MRRLVLAAASLSLAAVIACAPPPPPPVPDHQAESEAAIRAAVEKWNEAAQAKDVEKFALFYADDAVVMFAGAPDLKGGAAIREGLAGLMEDPAFSLSFQADQVIAARSGDVAYETGTYTLTTTGPDNKPVTESGHYVDVWRKQADGTWKVEVDAPVSD